MSIMSRKVRIKVEYEPRPIRHMVIQCPDCEKWFMPGDIVTKECIYPNYEEDIECFTRCKCPSCNCEFDLGNVEEDTDVSFPEFYEKVAKRKEVWE